MTQAIRFYSIDPRTGVEDTEYGHVWKHDDGQLEYENDIVRDIMANTVRRYGVDKAFTWFSDWGNGYSCSHLVEDGDPSYDEIAAMAEDDEAERAAGHDTTPGNDELHHYWTRGEGLAKWAESPKPWTTLVAHLARHVGERKAKIFASRWFIEVFHFASGSDMNRVTHGRPPRGQKVGPG